MERSAVKRLIIVEAVYRRLHVPYITVAKGFNGAAYRAHRRHLIVGDSAKAIFEGIELLKRAKVGYLEKPTL